MWVGVGGCGWEAECEWVWVGGWIGEVVGVCVFACDKTSATIVRVSSVNLKMVFSCCRKQRILVHYSKGYKVACRYSSDLKLLRSLSPNGLGRLVSKLLRSVCTDNFFTHSCLEDPCSLENCYANSKTATLTRKLLR